MKKEMMVTMEQRADHITELLSERGFDYKVTYRKVWKNNTEMDGFSASKDGTSIAPTVYLNGESDEQLADIIERAMQKKIPEVEVSNIFTKEYFKTHLRPRLIQDNAINREGLINADIAYISLESLGLLITLEISVDAIDDGSASIQLTYRHLDMVGYTVEEAYDIAVSNLEGQIEVSSMREIIISMMGIPEDEADDVLPDDGCGMYVLSTCDKRFGAAALLCPKAYELLKEKMGTDEIYILPSSVHEVIAIRKDTVMDASVLLNMVQEVNASQVAIQDQLADAVYASIGGNLIKVA